MSEGPAEGQSLGLASSLGIWQDTWRGTHSFEGSKLSPISMGKD